VTNDGVLAAIDVGTNAVRLEMARVLPDGTLDTVRKERDPVRPGEGVFTTGAMPRAVADRLLSTLRRYGALCKRHGARVRAVATSAVREAANRDEILRRVRDEAGIQLEVVSGKEEARLICLGILHGKPRSTRSLCLDIGGGSTEVATATGETPTALYSVSLGAVRLTEVFQADGEIGAKRLRLMREYAAEAVEEALPKRIPGGSKVALGSSGTINAVVLFAGVIGTPRATARQIARAVDDLVAMGPAGRRERFEGGRADIIVAGAVILEALARRLDLEAVVGVDRGLRDGLLVDLVRRARAGADDHSLADAALAMGRRFYFDEPHGLQVARLALRLFDDLAGLHGLPASARPYLEVAALLHDIGNAVSYNRHHRHTYYLIQNADLPGLADREREVVARIARYHRKSPPEGDHPFMQELSPSEARIVKKASTLLRVADSLDRSHHQPVADVRARAGKGSVELRVGARAPIDLEVWDLEHEHALFRRVFGKKLAVSVFKSGARRSRPTSRPA
jgi:exopolyphosphatase/guanosine-5'-triphosphate,3'-diphosphate pyrophosphatase